MTTSTTLYSSPIGLLRIVVDEAGCLCEIHFDGDREPLGPHTDSAQACAHVVAQLEEYFAGRRQTFDLELAAMGTEFQRDVWGELCRIPYGKTISYGELARRIDRPKAVRAVGQANGRNPIPIVVPCHRVIGATGTLTGFGGGLPTKRALLELEGVSAPLFARVHSE